jgi:hypothetical protein
MVVLGNPNGIFPKGKGCKDPLVKSKFFCICAKAVVRGYYLLLLKNKL